MIGLVDQADNLLEKHDMIFGGQVSFDARIRLRGIGRIGDHDPIAMAKNGDQMFQLSFPAHGKGSGMGASEGKDGDGDIAERAEQSC